ncbi:helix-turn-helix domain-containing protein [Burkholderia perseverans]|uniref:helix-turn-helix domain-containing protein n=1 Tax=Burkholderia perseverans TaxID=2615214 RepID=UPI003CC7EB8F
MARTRFKRDALEAIHGAAAGLHRAKRIDETTMHECDALCIEKAPQFNPADIARIRQDVNVGQRVFARYLNTTVSTVRQWEQGDRKPGRACCNRCGKTASRT